MKQKTLKKSAHFISILLNIGCIMFGIFSVSLFVGIMVIICVPHFSPEMVQSALETAVYKGKMLSFGQCVFFSFVVLENSSASFQHCIVLKVYLAVSAMEALRLHLKQRFRYAKLYGMFCYLLYFPCFPSSKCHLPHFLCAACLPSSCFASPLCLIMGVSYSRKQMKRCKGDITWQRHL